MWAGTRDLPIDRQGVTDVGRGRARPTVVCLDSGRCNKVNVLEIENKQRTGPNCGAIPRPDSGELPSDGLIASATLRSAMGDTVLILSKKV